MWGKGREVRGAGGVGGRQVVLGNPRVLSRPVGGEGRGCGEGVGRGGGGGVSGGQEAGPEAGRESGLDGEVSEGRYRVA